MAKISIYLPDKAQLELEAMATIEQRSVSNMVAVLVREGFASRNAPVVTLNVSGNPDAELVAEILAADKAGSMGA